MPAPLDRLSSLLERQRLHVRLHHEGAMCGVSHFDAGEGHAYLHLLRQGELQVRHPGATRGIARAMKFTQPTLLFYPRPFTHHFHNPPRGSDFTCARVAFEGGERHPLVRALPPVIALPLAAVDGLHASLDLLFAETERVRCGQRLLADRLFEVVVIQLLRWLLDHPQEAGIRPGLIAGLSDPRLARALSALHDDPGAPWSLDTMAAAAGMSRTAFANAFREAVGQTPADYLAGWRISLAQARLREGQPVKTLAEELGYANPSALSRAFATRTGLSPREWLASAGD